MANGTRFLHQDKIQHLPVTVKSIVATLTFVLPNSTKHSAVRLAPPPVVIGTDAVKTAVVRPPGVGGGVGLVLVNLLTTPPTVICPWLTAGLLGLVVHVKTTVSPTLTGRGLAVRLPGVGATGNNKDCFYMFILVGILPI